MKKLLVTACSAAAVLLGASPAAALTLPDRAQDDRACTAQQAHLTGPVSPTCQSGEVFLPPGRDGLETNHNETLVRDEA
ncbi:MAG TPA: hypothetical protein VK402_06730 [Blastococcus sp.]|nr:hypothetical protein [Blastococcus sp.]